MSSKKEDLVQIVINLPDEKLDMLGNYLDLLKNDQIGPSGVMPISIRDKMQAAGYSDTKSLFDKIETQNLKTSIRGNYFYSPLYRWIKFELALTDKEASELIHLLEKIGYIKNLII